MLQEGMNLNPQITVQVLENKLAMAAVREAQLEAAVQQLLQEKQELLGELSTYRAPDEHPEAFAEQEG